MQGKTSALLRLHLTNVAGAGAVQLLKSLLPAIERQSLAKVTEIHLPDRGDLKLYASRQSSTLCIPYVRWLPNFLSRIIECTVGGWRWPGVVPVLVLGDLPLRIKARQVVFVQTTHLTGGVQGGSTEQALKYRFARFIFGLNAKRVDQFIVQTEAMRVALLATYAVIAPKTVHVIPQPVPQWLLDSTLRRHDRIEVTSGLRLFYPAHDYPHKNHELLRHVGDGDWPLVQIVLTISPESSANPRIRQVDCVGFLAAEQMLAQYERADALVFLSLAESFGFPLIEAMWIGLPIVCPNLPYAHALCGDQAIYFEPLQPESFRQALWELSRRLKSDWWPDYNALLSRLPTSWDEVAEAFVKVTVNGASD